MSVLRSAAGATASVPTLAPQSTLLPLCSLNAKVAAQLGSLALVDLLGEAWQQALCEKHKLPQEALEALRKMWTTVASVQALGAKADVGTHTYMSAAIFQNYMLLLLKGALVCSALKVEQCRRLEEKAKSTTQLIKLRPAIGGRYKVRWQDGEWRFIDDWDSILGGTAKSECWQEEGGARASFANSSTHRSYRNQRRRPTSTI